MMWMSGVCTIDEVVGIQYAMLYQCEGDMVTTAQCTHANETWVRRRLLCLVCKVFVTSDGDLPLMATYLGQS